MLKIDERVVQALLNYLASKPYAHAILKDKSEDNRQ